MSEPAEPTPTRPLPTPAPRRRGGFLGRLIAALLVVIITTFLALVGVAAALFELGFRPEMPGQLADARARLSTAEALNAELRLQHNSLQTQVVALSQRAEGAHEALDELQQQIADLDRLREEFASGASQNATLVAEARTRYDEMARFATVEAGRAALLDDLKRRADRIERFLQRLSDISADAALDLSNGTPTVSADQTPAPPTLPAASVEPTPPSPTASPAATATLTPTATPRSTTTPRASPTPTP